MKPIVFLLISFVLISCNNRQKVNLTTESKGHKINSNLDFFKNHDFEVFYSAFISDSLFQKQHIIFPLKDAIYECDTTITLTRENWAFDSHDMRDYDKSLDSIIIKQEEDMLNYSLTRKEVGKLYEMRFERIKGTWYLVYYFVNAC